MTFNVQENAVFVHELTKNLSTVGGETYTLALTTRCQILAARLSKLGKAKGHRAHAPAPPPPVDWRKK